MVMGYKLNALRGIALLFTMILLNSCASMFGPDMTKIKIGMSKEEVIKNIGKPSTIVSAKKYEDGIQEILEYPTALQEDSSGQRFYWLHFFNNELKEWGTKQSYTNDFDAYYRRYRSRP